MATERLKEISENLHRLEEIFHRTDSGEDLQMIGQVLHAMRVTSASLTIRSGMAPLFLSLSLASVGFETGKDLGQALDKVVQGIVSFWKEKPDEATVLLVKKITTGIAVAAISAATLIGKGKEKEASRLSAELALLMLISSGLLKHTVQELILACGVAHGAATEALTLMALVLFIETTGEKSLWELAQGAMLASLTKIDEAAGSSGDQTALLALGQALKTLEKPEEMPALFDSLLKNLNLDSEGFKKDIDAIGRMSETIDDSCAVESSSIAEINVVA